MHADGASENGTIDGTAEAPMDTVNAASGSEQEASGTAVEASSAPSLEEPSGSYGVARGGGAYAYGDVAAGDESHRRSRRRERLSDVRPRRARRAGPSSLSFNSDGGGIDDSSQ